MIPYKKTPIDIKLTLIPFVVFIFLKIGDANTDKLTQIALVLFYLWLLSVLSVRPKTVFQILNHSHYAALSIFLLFLFLGFSYANGFFTTMKGIGAYIQVFSPIFMYEFYSKFLTKKTLRILIILILGIYIYYSVITIKYLEINPLAARDMVSYGVRDSLMIGGGFSLAYGFAILLPVLMYLTINYSKFREFIFINNLFTRIILISVAILFLVVIFKSMFAISFLVMLFGCVYVLLRMNKVKKVNNIRIFGAVLLAVFIALSANQIVSFFNSYLGSANSVINSKLLVVLNLSEHSTMGDTGSLGVRIQLYLESLQIWLENPFFGIAYRYDFDTSKMIVAGLGNHSEWLDSLAKYGIFFIFFIIYIYKSKKVYKNIQGYKLALILFIIIGLLNPIHLFNIYFVVFFYAPLLDNYFFGFKSIYLTKR